MLHCNRNTYEILRKTYREDIENQGKQSLLDLSNAEMERVSCHFRDISSISKTQDNLDKTNNDFIDKMLVNMEQERDSLERKLKFSVHEFSRKRFYTSKYPEMSETTAKIIMDEESKNELESQDKSINALIDEF